MYAKSIRPSAKREVQKGTEREVRRLNRAPQARSNWRAKRAARNENVLAKRPDFFLYIDNPIQLWKIGLLRTLLRVTSARLYFNFYFFIFSSRGKRYWFYVKFHFSNFHLISTFQVPLNRIKHLYVGTL